jgi:hypothetical protein
MVIDEFSQKRMYLEMKGFEDKAEYKYFVKHLPDSGAVSVMVPHDACIYMNLTELQDHVFEAEQELANVTSKLHGDYEAGLLTAYRYNLEGDSYLGKREVSLDGVRLTFSIVVPQEEVATYTSTAILLDRLELKDKLMFEEFLNTFSSIRGDD